MPASSPALPTYALMALMLAALSILGPFSVDTYLPAFPAMSASLHASDWEVQQTLSIYMFSFALMMLWHGALSDAFGRRRVILVSLMLFALASLGCALASTVHGLWAFRALQGVSAGAGIVIGRAMIRDLHAGSQAEKLLALVNMIFSIGPAIAPVIGGYLVKWFNWHAIFVFLLAYALLLVAICYKRLPESLPEAKRQPFHPRLLWKNYLRVFGSMRFQLKAGTIAFNFSGLFLLVSSAPVIVTRHLGLGSEQFAWLFVPAVAGIFLGSLTVSRMAGRLTIARQVGIGYWLMIGAGVFSTLYHSIFPPALPWTVLPTFFYTAGMSMAMPGIMLMVLELFPDIRGTAASCQSFTMTMLASVVAGVVAPLLSPSMVWLAAGQLGSVLIGFVLWTCSSRMRAARLQAS